MTAEAVAGPTPASADSTLTGLRGSGASPNAWRLRRSTSSASLLLTSWRLRSLPTHPMPGKDETTKTPRTPRRFEGTGKPPGATRSTGLADASETSEGASHACRQTPFRTLVSFVSWCPWWFRLIHYLPIHVLYP